MPKSAIGRERSVVARVAGVARSGNEEVSSPGVTSRQPGCEPEVEGESVDQARRLMHGPSRVHHVAVVVRSLEDSLELYRDLLDLELENVVDIASDGVRIAFLGVGESKIELVQPTDPTTGVARFLDSRGEGFHHVCLEVANLAEELTRLAIDGVELIDSAPRRGAEGPVAFLHPRSCHGVLVELIEAPGGPAWRSLGYPPARA